MHNINGSTYLTTNEAAERIGVAAATLRLWRHNGNRKLPWLKVGSAVLYLESDVIAFAKTYERSR